MLGRDTQLLLHVEREKGDFHESFLRSCVGGPSRRPFAISASGSLDLEDLHGVGRPNWFQKGPAKAAVASVTA